ncbi:MAG: hypothetical protein ACM3H8_01400, partial [Sphingobacteriales bacterium]
KKTVAFTVSLLRIVEIFFITPVLKFVMTGTDSASFQRKWKGLKSEVGIGRYSGYFFGGSQITSVLLSYDF